MAYARTAELNALENRLLELELKFIEPHSSPTESPSEYLLDLQSYAILSHAAFEEYVELITVKVADESYNKFKNENKISFTTLCMLHFVGAHDSLNNWENSDRLYDKILTKLGSINNKIKEQVKENNGMNLKYLKQLLIPVGLEIPHTTKEIGAFDKLAKYRGDFAHKSTTGLSVIPTPSDVVTVVGDVLDYMNALDKQAISVSYFRFTTII